MSNLCRRSHLSNRSKGNPPQLRCGRNLPRMLHRRRIRRRSYKDSRHIRQGRNRAGPDTRIWPRSYNRGTLFCKHPRQTRRNSDHPYTYNRGSRRTHSSYPHYFPGRHMCNHSCRHKSRCKDHPLADRDSRLQVRRKKWARAESKRQAMLI